MTLEIWFDFVWPAIIVLLVGGGGLIASRYL